MPTLVAHAVNRLADVSVTVEELARRFGVKVRAGDPNPWRLGVASRDDLAGVSLARAELEITAWLEQSRIPVAFAFAALNQVPFHDGEVFYEEHSGSASFVGVALDWATLVESPGRALHVVEVDSYRGSFASVVDLTQPTPVAQTFPIQRFETAIAVANGGFLTFEGRALADTKGDRR